MALAVVATGLLRAALPHELRNGDAAWLFLVLVVGLLAVLIIGDPGRIDRDRPWLHNLTSVMIGLISVANADAAIRLVVGHHQRVELHAERQGVARQWRCHLALQHHHLRPVVLEPRPGRPGRPRPGRYVRPALIFPEMLHPQHVGEDWTPTFVDYFHFAFATATAFSPTDVSAVKPWMKLMMMAEEAISLVVAILVVARAVNILK